MTLQPNAMSSQFESFNEPNSAFSSQFESLNEPNSVTTFSTRVHLSKFKNFFFKKNSWNQSAGMSVSATRFSSKLEHVLDTFDV